MLPILLTEISPNCKMIRTLNHCTRKLPSSYKSLSQNLYSTISCNLQICNALPLAFNSVQFSRSVMSNSLRPHESQNARPPCPSLMPRIHSYSHPSSPWCHPAISSSVVPFSSCPQSLPASRSFPMSQIFAWGGKSIGVAASASVLQMTTQDWSPLGWAGWRLDLLAVQGTLKSLLQHHGSKASILRCSAFFTVQFSHPYMTTGKTIALTRQTFSEVTQSRPTLCDPVDGILQARILEWVAFSFSRGSSRPSDWTQVSHIAGRCFNLWAIRLNKIFPQLVHFVFDNIKYNHMFRFCLTIYS